MLVFNRRSASVRGVLASTLVLLAALGAQAPAKAAHGSEDTQSRVASLDNPEIRHQLQHVFDHALSHSKPRFGAGLLAISNIRSEADDVFVLVSGRHSHLDPEPIDRATPYGIASVTKTMVAALVLIYAERGQLSLETPVLRLVEDETWLLEHISNRKFRKSLKSVTFRELLSHRSGLADYWENEAFFSVWLKARNKQWRPSEVLEWAGRQDPVCAPASCFEYSDTNYVIAGLALERLTGMELHEQLRQEIFAPLGMTCTWMYFEEPVPEGCAAPTHSYDAELDVTEHRLQSADWSGGGLYSTLDDQLAFMRGLFHEGLLSTESLAEMRSWDGTGQDGTTGYGLGVYQTSAGPGMTLTGHTGIHNSFMFLWEETGVLITGSLNQLENAALEHLVYPAIRVLKEDGGYVDHSH